LDAFLSYQTHIPYKIVLRGNHDPSSFIPFHYQYKEDDEGKKKEDNMYFQTLSSSLSNSVSLFPKSKAIYVISTTNLSFRRCGSGDNDDVFMNMVCEPFTRRHQHHYRTKELSSSSAFIKPLSTNCDVLISHEPPRGICDVTYTGVCAGSVVLRRQVELLSFPKKKGGNGGGGGDDDYDSTNLPPRLWLCGHIHEGRGLSQTQLLKGSNIIADGGDKENDKGAKMTEETKKIEEVDGDEMSSSSATTLVVNAANANLGKAYCLVAGAVVVDLECDNTNSNITDAINDMVLVDTTTTATSNPTPKDETNYHDIHALLNMKRWYIPKNQQEQTEPEEIQQQQQRQSQKDNEYSKKHHFVGTKKINSKRKGKKKKSSKKKNTIDDLDGMITRPGVRRRRGLNALRKRVR